MISSKNKIYASFIVCLAALIIVFGGFSYLIFGAITKGSARIVSDKKEVMAMALEDRVVTNFKATYNNYQLDLEKAAELFVDSANPIAFITFLEGISADSGVVTDISIAPSQKSDNAKAPQPISFQINADGEYENIVRFTRALEVGPYLVKVINMDIRKVDLSRQGEKTAPQSSLQAHFLVQALAK